MTPSPPLRVVGLPPVFSAFDAVRIINLRTRSDRRRETKAELERIGADRHPDIGFFDAIAPSEAGRFTSKGAHGVYLSHLAILEHSATANRSVLILEDDVDFAPEVSDYVIGERFEMFYGAYMASDPSRLTTSNIIGAHFMGFDAQTAARLVTYLKAVLLGAAQPPIDGAYVWFRREHPGLRVVFAVPPLGDQRPSRSDIAQSKWFDGVPGLDRLAVGARRLKRRLNRHARRAQASRPS